jgi:hypothetical protein
MIKAFAPLGLLVLLPMMDVAEARTCAPNQIYRVLLHKCASKSANIQYYKGASRHARPGKSEVTTVAKTVKPAATPRSEVASLRRSARPESLYSPPADDAGPIDAPEQAIQPAPLSQSGGPTPFGGLPSVSSFK